MLKQLRSVFLAAALLSCALPVPAADLSITAASVVPSSAARVATYTAGATITAGQLVYFDATTSTAKLADADASLAASTVLGIAINGAASGQPVNVCSYDPALTIGATVAAGEVYVCSSTAGAIGAVADLASGWYATVVAVGISTTKVCFVTDARALVPK